jgi:hypothetical protein
MPHPSVPPEEAWRAVQPWLDQELNGLPDKYRLPLVLCHLQGRSRKEVAQQLRLAPGTLSSRLATARQLLAGRLARHGVCLAAGTLAALLGEQTAAAVPAPLTASTVQVAALWAAGKSAAGLLPPRVADLTRGVLQTMFMTKLKVASLYVLMAACVLALTAGAWLHRTQAQTQTDRSVGSAVQPASAASTQDAREQERETKTVTGKLDRVDTNKNTITILTVVSRTDPPVEKTLPLAKDCNIVQDGQKVKLGDLKKDHRATLTLAPDEKSVVGISITGPTLAGKLLSVDAANKTITVSFGPARDGSTVDKTFTLAGERPSVVQDGKQVKLGNLKCDNHVVVGLSTDEKTVFSITVAGKTVTAEFKSFDAKKDTITVLLSPRDTEDKTFALTKGIKVLVDRKEAPLTELKAGMTLALTFSAVEGNTVLRIHVQQPGKER